MVKLSEKLFGAKAVKKGYVSKEQVVKALEIQYVFRGSKAKR